MELLKLIKNRISSEWKKTFNDNVDILNRNAHDQDQKLNTTNSRIDNLVLHSGGDSSNEVVDARVNNKAVTFSTLSARLLNTENVHDQDFQQLNLTQAVQQKQLEQQNNAVGKLMGTYGATLDIYVSGSNGNDKTGDGTEEHPFKTIQMAVNMLPLISTATITIWVDDGVYLEDIVISSVSATQLHIRPKSYVNTSAYKTGEDLPVKVRSIRFGYCSGYFRLFGLQAVDQASTSTAFYIENNGYLAVASCKCGENTKSNSEHVAVKADGNAKCHIYSSYFENQNTAFYALLMSEMNVAEENGGKNNTVGVVANNATVRTGITSSNFATTQNKALYRGLIITKGTVLS